MAATAIARPGQVKPRRLRGASWAVVPVSVDGFGGELRQGVTPNRSMEFADWVAATPGAAAAGVAYLRGNGYRCVLETPLRRRRRRQPDRGQPRVEILSEPLPNQRE